MTLGQMTIKQMQNIDILNIDPDSVTEACDITIDINLPVAERMAAYIQQTKNPYFIKVGKVIVKMKFSDTDTTVNDCFMKYMRTS